MLPLHSFTSLHLSCLHSPSGLTRLWLIIVGYAEPEETKSYNAVH